LFCFSFASKLSSVCSFNVLYFKNKLSISLISSSVKSSFNVVFFSIDLICANSVCCELSLSIVFNVLKIVSTKSFGDLLLGIDNLLNVLLIVFLLTSLNFDLFI